ncbi:hypothetical protein CHS0354_039699 [Potamilus streckersoni]|uniref:Uncharacterized protein n=1 Tax=Potamilus streckersoni TaxID=2493646 RepID=A0AAE0SF74_9BIVA|nr:hypothetical protein CHS0354_039699 [Potamilus streckersoni]
MKLQANTMALPYTEVIGTPTTNTTGIHPGLIGLPPLTQTELVLAGYNDCAEEAIRYLVEVENFPYDDPLVQGLKSHLEEQKSLLDIPSLVRDSINMSHQIYSEYHDQVHFPLCHPYLCFNDSQYLISNVPSNHLKVEPPSLPSNVSEMYSNDISGLATDVNDASISQHSALDSLSTEERDLAISLTEELWAMIQEEQCVTEEEESVQEEDSIEIIEK